MADLAASIAKARKAGYSDAEITAYIAKDPAMGPKVATARKAGYSDAEIVGHLGKPNTTMDVIKSGASGVVRSVAGMGDIALAASPMGGGVSDAIDAVNAATGGRPRGQQNGPRTSVSDLYGRITHAPQTRAGRYSEAIGEAVPNALAPGGLVRKVASVVLPGAAGEGAREGVEAMGGNQLAQAAAKFAGNLLGGFGASARVNLRPPARSPVSPLPRQNANELAARAAEYRASGINPTLVDVVDDSARGTVRAAASRQTPARQRATDFQDARANDLPSRMGGQARRVVSRDPRTPDQIRAAEVARRGANADRNFGAVRGDTVQLAPEGVEALRTDYGRAAIREAARRERDPNTRAALNRLAEAALDNPSTPITVGMADRVSRVLLGQAQEAARRGDNDLATTLGGLGRSVRTPTAQASPGYQAALDDYGADTRLTQAAEVGEGLLRPNTDEFVAAATNLSPRERVLAAAAARRAIERKAGENVGSAPGVARAIANAPEQQARTRALIGPARAAELEQGMRLEERLVRNANDVAPRAGSQTQTRMQDAANIARGGIRLARGDIIGVGLDWLRSRGISDQQAEQLVNMALDPAQTDQAIALIAQRFGPQARGQFLEWRNAALIGATAAGSAAATATQGP